MFQIANSDGKNIEHRTNEIDVSPLFLPALATLFSIKKMPQSLIYWYRGLNEDVSTCLQL